MWRTLIIVVLAACEAHSAIGPVVTDIRLSSAGLDVKRCSLVEDAEVSGWTFALAPVFVFGVAAAAVTGAMVPGGQGLGGGLSPIVIWNRSVRLDSCETQTTEWTVPR